MYTNEYTARHNMTRAYCEPVIKTTCLYCNIETPVGWSVDNLSYTKATQVRIVSMSAENACPQTYIHDVA